MSDNRAGPAPEPMDTRPMTWALLLSRWTEFAQAAVALPRDAEGQRWRASIAPVIGLQAVTMALGEAGALAEDELALALDRAEVLVRQHAASLNSAWRGVPLPERLTELLEDARLALERAQHLGVEWVVAEPRVEVGSLEAWARGAVEGGFAGELMGAAPGTVLFEGEPVAFARPGLNEDPPGLVVERRLAPAQQVYRRTDEASGRWTGDMIVPFSAPLVAGRPLLVALVEGGRVVFSQSEAERGAWRSAQRAAMEGVPVRIERAAAREEGASPVDQS